MPVQNQVCKVVVLGVEPRQWPVEDLPQSFEHLQVRHVPALLVLIDARRRNRNIQPCHDAQLPLRKAGRFPCLAHAQRHDAQRIVRWRVL